MNCGTEYDEMTVFVDQMNINLIFLDLLSYLTNLYRKLIKKTFFTYTNEYYMSETNFVFDQQNGKLL